MGKKHKYFRNLDYKNHLENQYNAFGRRAPVYFITKSPDPRYLREKWHWLMMFDNDFRAAYLFDTDLHGCYVYYDKRPEVEYSILKYKHQPSLRKRKIKKYLNKALRMKIKNMDELYQNNNYKKIVTSCWLW